jgi:hypothetical protein
VKARIIVNAQYFWWSDINNNVKWIWERSLWLPTAAKGKQCYLLWNKISWSDWWTIRWYLWRNHNWSSYYFSEKYEASINVGEQKIEISKRNWYNNVNLSKTERNNLYFSISMICK